jgi:hypothetical protein
LLVQVFSATTYQFAISSIVGAESSAREIELFALLQSRNFSRLSKPVVILDIFLAAR